LQDRAVRRQDHRNPPSRADAGKRVPVTDRPRVARPGRPGAEGATRRRATWRTAMNELAVILRGVYGVWLREIMRATRDRGQLIGGVSRPLIWLLILGVGLNPYFRGEVYGQVSYVIPYTYLQFLFPAVIVLNIMYTSIQFAVSVIWDREFGFLREVLVSPMPRSMIL